MQVLFVIVVLLFIVVSGLLVFSVLLQEPKQSGGLGDLGGGGSEFSTMGGVSGGLQRVTVGLGIAWGVLAIALSLIPR